MEKHSNFLQLFMTSHGLLTRKMKSRRHADEVSHDAYALDVKKFLYAVNNKSHWMYVRVYGKSGEYGWSM